MTSLTLQIDETMAAQLDEIAAARELPRETLISEALSGYLDFEARQIAKIKKGLAEADRGEFATEEELDGIETEIQARIDARS